MPTPWAAQSSCFSYREQPGVLPGANNIFGKYAIMGHGGSISKHKNFGLRFSSEDHSLSFCCGTEVNKDILLFRMGS